MSSEIQCTCRRCNGQFWIETPTRVGWRVPELCANCRTTNGSRELSTALATVEQLRSNTGLGPLLPDSAALFGDIRQLLADASAPIEVRRRKFWEWMRGIDLRAQQLEQKIRAGDAARHLLRQRLDFIRQLQEVARLQYEAAEAEAERRKKSLQAHLDELKLEEEIARQQALRDERIKTEQLEETRKQARLLNEINPPAPPPEPKKKDPAKQAINDHRRGVRAKSTAKQLELSDFITEVRKHFGAHEEDTIKVVRIRTVMEVYRQDLEALPKDIREYIEGVESGEYEPLKCPNGAEWTGKTGTGGITTTWPTTAEARDGEHD